MFFVPFGFKFVFFLARLSPEVKINEKMKKVIICYFKVAIWKKKLFTPYSKRGERTICLGGTRQVAQPQKIFLSIINALNEVADYIPP